MSGDGHHIVLVDPGYLHAVNSCSMGAGEDHPPPYFVMMIHDKVIPTTILLCSWCMAELEIKIKQARTEAYARQEQERLGKLRLSMSERGRK